MQKETQKASKSLWDIVTLTSSFFCHHISDITMTELYDRIIDKGLTVRRVNIVAVNLIMLISVSAGFCKTYFCFQCAVSELKFAKCLLPELNLANLN